MPSERADPLEHAELRAIPHPCTACRHLARCKHGLACECLKVFIATGRISPFAPRQPSVALFERLYAKEPARWSPAEKVAKREAAAVAARRERY